MNEPRSTSFTPIALDAPRAPVRRLGGRLERVEPVAPELVERGPHLGEPRPGRPGRGAAWRRPGRASSPLAEHLRCGLAADGASPAASASSVAVRSSSRARRSIARRPGVAHGPDGVVERRVGHGWRPIAPSRRSCAARRPAPGPRDRRGPARGRSRACAGRNIATHASTIGIEVRLLRRSRWRDPRCGRAGPSTVPAAASRDRPLEPGRRHAASRRARRVAESRRRSGPPRRDHRPASAAADVGDAEGRERDSRARPPCGPTSVLDVPLGARRRVGLARLGQTVVHHVRRAFAAARSNSVNRILIHARSSFQFI